LDKGRDETGHEFSTAAYIEAFVQSADIYLYGSKGYAHRAGDLLFGFAGDQMSKRLSLSRTKTARGMNGIEQSYGVRGRIITTMDLRRIIQNAAHGMLLLTKRLLTVLIVSSPPYFLFRQRSA
jgi:hypothetical protein